MIITEIDDEYPQFAQIKDIFIADTKITFEVNIFNTLSFCRHFHAYELRETSQQKLFYIDNLEFAYTEILRHCNSKLFVVVRYHIAGTIV